MFDMPVMIIIIVDLLYICQGLHCIVYLSQSMKEITALYQ